MEGMGILWAVWRAVCSVVMSPASGTAAERQGVNDDATSFTRIQLEISPEHRDFPEELSPWMHPEHWTDCASLRTATCSCDDKNLWILSHNSRWLTAPNYPKVTITQGIAISSESSQCFRQSTFRQYVSRQARANLHFQSSPWRKFCNVLLFLGIPH